MRQEEWDAWRAWAVGEYADDMMRNEALTREQAVAQAEEETDALLTDGLDTPEHHLFVADDVGSVRHLRRRGGPRPWHRTSAAAAVRG
jgi:hypothetical protein